MIQEIMEKANQLYTGFVVAPVEYQVAIGIAALVVIAALKNVWSILYPVRWTAASLLRVAAFLIHPRKRKPKVKKGEGVEPVMMEAPPFDVSTYQRFEATMKHYAPTWDKGRKLSDAQLKLLADAGHVWNKEAYGDLMKQVSNLRQARSREAKAKALMNPQPELVTAAPAPVTVKRDTPSEADVA